ncbi:hypothetical protein M0Q50_09835 [bacterium]|jgi:hypothetical protein|nr:hypothetical protein [bacterium]
MKKYPKDKFYFLNNDGTKKEPKDLEHYHNTEYYFSWKLPFIKKKFVTYQLLNNIWYELDFFIPCLKNSKLTLFPRKFRNELYIALTKEENQKHIIEELQKFSIYFCLDDYQLTIHNLDELEKVKDELKILQRFDKLNSI